MKVVIMQRTVDYTSDYPDGWKFSAGDPFKFPVLLGDHPCFIKRFEQKGPEDISGWDLLVNLSGKFEKNLSRVYDIKNVQEDDKEIYYVFYEYLEGITLDKYIQEPDINLIHLNNDLFNAIRALQKYEFWFADFFEKNIFCQKNGTFVLVDVDSTQRISDLPDNEMYGSKDYWILVLKFYKEILNKNDLRLSDINGISLNYLQIPFLVLRLKLFLNGDRKDYNSTQLFNQLPSQLDKMAPEFREIYLNVIKNGKDLLSDAEISTIEAIVERKIIKTEIIPEVVVAPVSLPVINEFKTSKGEIESGGTFTLSWLIENADKLELYKNGAMFKALDINEKEITLTGFADGTRQQSSYQLYAYKDLALAKSNPITVKLKDSEPEPIRGTGSIPDPKKRTRLIIIGIALLVLVFGAVFLFNNNSKDPKPPIDDNKDSMTVGGFRPKRIQEGKDHTVKFFGTNFPDTGSADFNKIEVSFNGTRVKVLPGPENTLSVVAPVPLLKQALKGNPLSIPVEVRFGAENLFSDTLICDLDKEIKIDDFIPKNLRNQTPVVFSGKNLDASENFTVTINGIACRILSRQNNSLVAQAPLLTNDLIDVPVGLSVGGRSIYLGKGYTRIKFRHPDIIKADALEKVKLEQIMKRIQTP